VVVVVVVVVVAASPLRHTTGRGSVRRPEPRASCSDPAGTAPRRNRPARSQSKVERDSRPAISVVVIKDGKGLCWAPTAPNSG